MDHRSWESSSTFFLKTKKTFIHFSPFVCLTAKVPSCPCFHSTCLLSMTKQDLKSNYIRRSKRWIFRKDLLIQGTSQPFSAIHECVEGLKQKCHLRLQELATSNLDLVIGLFIRKGAVCSYCSNTWIVWWGGGGGHVLQNVH